MSATPPSDPWNDPPGGYPPPPPPGYPGGGYPGGGYPGGGYPGGGYPGGGYPGGGYPGGQWDYDRRSTPSGRLAGWWRRVGATIVDGLLVGIPVAIVLGIVGVKGLDFTAIDDLCLVAYQIILIGMPRCQTVGNMAASTRVVDAASGMSIGPGRAAVRAIVQLVLNITVIGGLLDIFWPLWDRRNQTLHDKAAGSLVVLTGY